MEIRSWKQYYKNRGQGPRDEVVSAVSHVKNIGCALDLGAGSFVESRFLLEKGFEVIAVDPEKPLIKMASKIDSEKFFFECQKTEDYIFPKDCFDFVCANFSLQFVPKNNIARVFDSIFVSMKTDGIFALQILGAKDQRNGSRIDWCERRSFYTEDEVSQLIKSFKVIQFKEIEEPRKLVNGRTIKGHIFDLILKK